MLEQLAAIDGPVTIADLDRVDGLGPPPWTSFVPGRSQATVAAWVELAKRTNASAADQREVPGVMPIFEESEPVGVFGENETPATGELIPNLGAGPDENFDTRVFGSLFLPPPSANCVSIEDDGAIPLANSTIIGAFADVDLCGGFLGDGPYGASSGDIDVFDLNYVAQGNEILIDVGTFDPQAGVPKVITGVYNSAGDLIASTEDGGDTFLETRLTVIAPETDRYYAVVAGCCTLPTDVFDSSTGAGVTTTGDYLAFMGSQPPPACTPDEPNDSTGTANFVDLTIGIPADCLGVVGDGEFGESSGDFDFYVTPDLTAGTPIIIDVLTPPEGPEVVVGIYDSAGTLIDSFEDKNEDSFYEFMVPADDSYFVAIGACCELPSDPSTPGTGPGAADVGPYVMFIVPPPPDIGEGVLPPIPDEGYVRSEVSPRHPANAWSDAEATLDSYDASPTATLYRSSGLANQAAEAPAAPCRSTEDDGTLLSSNPVLFGSNGLAFCSSEIGNGPFGASSGDFDLFALGDFAPGESGEVLLGANGPDSALDPSIDIVDAAGQVIASSESLGPGAAVVVFQSLEGGPLWARYSAVGSVQADVTDSGSGSGATSVGEYVSVLVTEPDNQVNDVDVYLVDLNPGDVVRIAMAGAGSSDLVRPDGTTAQGSSFSASFIYPRTSPLRHLGGNGSEHVADAAGLHAIAISQGGGPYEAEIRVIRAGLTYSEGSDAQILFLDFDGADLDPSLFDPFRESSEQPMSPLSSFLGNWGLDASDEDALIDQIIAVVEEDYNEDLPITGGNGDRDSSNTPGEFDVEIRNSRDHGDLWGQPNVTRIIIGGTIDELGIGTVGIAQSIDPGNYDTEESTIVLLDLLSLPAEAEGAPTLNQWPVANKEQKIALVARGIGSIASHEAGHVLGNWHTETSNEALNIMDAGGSLADTVGVGPDGVWGTDDDTDLDHITDVYSQFEGFRGIENTASRTARALSTGRTAPPDDEIEPGVYVIKNVERGRYLHADGTQNVNTSTSTGVESQWELSKVGDRWRLRNQGNNFYLDADGAAENYNVELSPNPTDDDEWTITSTGNGSWLLRNRVTNRYLDSDPGPAYNVDQSVVPSADDEWIFRLVDDGDFSGGDELVGKVIRLRNGDNGRYLFGDNSANGYNTRTASAVSNATSWTVSSAGDGTVYLRNVATGRYLDTDADGSVDTSAEASSDDRWQVIVRDGFVNLRSIDRNQFLDADGADENYDVNLSTVARADDSWTIDILE